MLSLIVRVRFGESLSPASRHIVSISKRLPKKFSYSLRYGQSVATRIVLDRFIKLAIEFACQLPCHTYRFATSTAAPIPATRNAPITAAQAAVDSFGLVGVVEMSAVCAAVDGLSDGCTMTVGSTNGFVA